MASKTQELTENLILSLLKGNSKGLTATEVIECLNSEGKFSPRAIRNLLNELTLAGKILKAKQWTSNAGKPPFAYFHPEDQPQQLNFLDQLFGVTTQIQTKTQVEKNNLSSEARKINEEAYSVLERIAREHLAQDAHAWAIVQVAPELSKTNPVDLLLEMAQWIVNDINALADEVQQLWNKNLKSESEDRAGELQIRLEWAKHNLQRMWRLDNKIGNNIPGILDLPAWAKNCKAGERAFIDVDKARQRLQERVRGNYVIEIIGITPHLHKAGAGTDASVADILLEHRQGSFIPPEAVAVTTSAAVLITHDSDSTNFPTYQDFDIFPDQLKEYGDYRAASEGLLLSPALKKILPEGDFKHSRMAAMDLRQYHEDRRVLQKTAKWRPIGNMPMLDIEPKATIIFRDGRIFPLVHRLDDYESGGLYGQIVRKEIETFSYVVQPTLSGPASNVVYAAAVKDPEMSFLASMIFWYIYSRNIQQKGKSVVSKDDVYSVPFGDTAVAHLLFLGLAKMQQKKVKNNPLVEMFVTFRGLRRFSDIGIKNGLAILHNQDKAVQEDSLEDWENFIQERVAEKKRKGEEPIDVEDYEPFTYLLSQVGVSMCYAAPANTYDFFKKDSEGNHFLLPRLEVAIDMQKPRQEQNKFERMLSWLASGHCALDSYHTQTSFNKNSKEKGLPILVPDVTLSAHEVVGFARDILGQEVQDELRSLVADLKKRLKL
jgi:hypothetical protein